MFTFETPTLESRVKIMYPEQVDKICKAIYQGIVSIPFVESEDEHVICFDIQMYIPVDVWVIVTEGFALKSWEVSKQTTVNATDRKYDIHKVFINHTRV